MKTIKYFFIGALMTVVSAPVMAQNTLDDAIKVVKSNASVKEKEAALKEAKFNKKNAADAVKVGNAFLSAGDTLNTRKYAEMAKKADKKFGDAYILLGDLEAHNDNPGAAAGWYEQAIYFDPNNESGYTRYAAINSYSSPRIAVETLEKLRTIRPDYPVDADAGHIYYNVFMNKGGDDNKKSSVEHYKKVNKDKLSINQLTEFALISFLDNDFETSAGAAQYGASKEPRNAGFNRLLMYNYTDLKQYDKAVTYIDKLFNQSDSAKFTRNDYMYAGLALEGAEKYADALVYYKKQLDESKTDAELSRALRSISDCNASMKNYAEAIEYFKKYMDKKGEITINDENSYAGLHQRLANTLEGDAKTNALQKAADIYVGMTSKYADNADFCYYKAAQANAMLDPTSEKGLAKPYYEKLASLVEGHGINSNADKARAIEAYSYLGYYNYKANQQDVAKSYYQKLLQVDPENAGAKQVLEVLK